MNDVQADYRPMRGVLIGALISWPFWFLVFLLYRWVT